MTDHLYLQDLKNLSAKAKDTAEQAKASVALSTASWRP